MAYAFNEDKSKVTIVRKNKTLGQNIVINSDEWKRIKFSLPNGTDIEKCCLSGIGLNVVSGQFIIEGFGFLVDNGNPIAYVDGRNVTNSQLTIGSGSSVKYIYFG